MGMNETSSDLKQDEQVLDTVFFFALSFNKGQFHLISFNLNNLTGIFQHPFKAFKFLFSLIVVLGLEKQVWTDIVMV